jgi:tape measure domain-containing protein
MSDQKISLSIEVDDNGSIVVKQFGDKTVRTTRDTVSKSDSLLKKIQDRLGLVKRAAGGILTKLTSLKTVAVGALVGWGVKKLAGSFLEVGSSMDQLKLSLDTITKGEGAEWFQKLNEWALKMPINTKTAIEAFTQMRAMGLQPTIDQMTTLVDTTSALGGGSDTLLGISRALGQIATKGRVSTEELLQLAERGVPVFEILREKMNFTQEQLGNIGNQGLDAQQTIQVLIEGMAERFGGQSEKMQSMWAGLWESAKSYFAEFKRMVMESGVMDYLEDKLGAVMAKVEQWYQDGTMLELAQQIADGFMTVFDSLGSYISLAWENISQWYYKVSDAVYWMGEDSISVAKAISNQFANVVTAIKQVYSWYKKIQSIASKVESFLGGITPSGLNDWIADATGYTAAHTTTDTSASVPQYASGTGPAGLPYTGLFYGHQGEIVKNPAESAAERRGTSGSVNLTVAPRYMTGDRNTARAVAVEIKRELDRLGLRWGTANG